MKLYDTDVSAIKNNVIVSDMTFGERQSRGGIIKLIDDGIESGIHPRWGQVYSIGPDQKDVKVGEGVLVKHGRWTRGIDIIQHGKKRTIRRIDIDDILIVSDEPNEADY